MRWPHRAATPKCKAMGAWRGSARGYFGLCATLSSAGAVILHDRAEKSAERSADPSTTLGMTACAGAPSADLRHWMILPAHPFDAAVRPHMDATGAPL